MGGVGGADEKQGVWNVRDRGGGTSSPSPSAPPPNAISPRSSARLPTGSTPGTAFHQVSRALPPPAGRGRGRSAGGAGGVGAAGRECTGIPTKARVGWGCRQRCMGSLLAKARVGWRLPVEVYGYLAASRVGDANESEDWDLSGGECTEQIAARGGCQRIGGLGSGDRGGGKRPPSPSASPPMAISTTVHCMGISRERPGHGFPPGIATHGPLPREGAGEERRRRGRGGGCRRSVWLSPWMGGRRRVWQRHPNSADSHRPAPRATGSVPDACAPEGDLLRRICEEDVGETYAKQNIARDGFEPSVYGL